METNLLREWPHLLNNVAKSLDLHQSFWPDNLRAKATLQIANVADLDMNLRKFPRIGHAGGLIADSADLVIAREALGVLSSQAMAPSRIIKLAVREFALPVPRVGSIEAHSGFGGAPEEGQAAHLRIQEARLAAFPQYRAEVFIKHEFSQGKYRFQIAGRIDGLFDGESPRIEEIKTAFHLDDLSKKLREAPETHPYCLQLRTYGYLHALQTQKEPTLNFHLVSLRNRNSEDIFIPLDLAGYEIWLAARLLELEKETQLNEARAKRRKKLAKALSFPFQSPRPSQIDLISTVEDHLKLGKRLLVQAPTGLGKTIGVMYPTLKETLERGQNLIYVTPKNSQHAVAEDAIDRFFEAGANVKALTLTAKSKICLKAEPLCNPEYCEYAKDHYSKIAEKNILELLAKKRRLDAKGLRKLGEEHQVCPFELQFEAAKNADVVICDYNYVFSPRSASGRIGGTAIGQQGKPSLVIDEAHNLPARGMSYYSPSLSTAALEMMRVEIRALPEKFRADAETLLESCLQTILSCQPAIKKQSQIIEAPSAVFLEQESRVRDLLTRYLDSDVEIRPRDIILRLSFYWSEFTAALGFVGEDGRPEFFTSYQFLRDGGAIKITCCDASEMLKSCYDEFEQVVGFSATMKPFDYYAKLSGLIPIEIGTAEFESPFSKTHRKLLIIPQISTKFSDRDRNYPRIAETISRIVKLRRGNYFAFFPSFDFLERVAALYAPPEGTLLLKQKREMKSFEIQAVLDQLASLKPTVVFAVQGGVFSEGVDYPGDTIIGAFVVGPPLPIFDHEREAMRSYYEEKYEAGFDYAYAFPAMAKAVQAAGRVIRSESDRGLIVLMDGRFLHKSYTQSMPKDWFEKGAGELVSESILDEVSRFWEEPGPQ